MTSSEFSTLIDGNSFAEMATIRGNFFRNEEGRIPTTDRVNLLFLVNEVLETRIPTSYGGKFRADISTGQSAFQTAYYGRVKINFCFREYTVPLDPEVIAPMIAEKTGAFLADISNNLEAYVNIFRKTKKYRTVCYQGFCYDIVAIMIEIPIWGYDDFTPFKKEILNRIYSDGGLRVKKDQSIWLDFISKLEAKLHDYKDSKLPLATLKTYKLSWFKILHDVLRSVYNDKIIEKNLFPKYVSKNKLASFIVDSYINENIGLSRTEREKNIIRKVCKYAEVHRYLVNDFVKSLWGPGQFTALDWVKLPINNKKYTIDDIELFVDQMSVAIEKCDYPKRARYFLFKLFFPMCPKELINLYLDSHLEEATHNSYPSQAKNDLLEYIPTESHALLFDLYNLINPTEYMDTIL